MVRLSIGTRWRIVALRVDARWSLRRIAEHFNVSLGGVRFVLQTFEETEDVLDRPRFSRRQRTATSSNGSVGFPRPEYGVRAHVPGGSPAVRISVQSNTQCMPGIPEIFRTSDTASWKNGTLYRNIGSRVTTLAPIRDQFLKVPIWYLFFVKSLFFRDLFFSRCITELNNVPFFV